MIPALPEAQRLIPEFKKDDRTSLAVTVETPPHRPGMTF